MKLSHVVDALHQKEGTMKLSTDVIYDMLSEKYTLRRYGRKARERELLLPVFYNPRMQTRKRAVYVCRTEDLARKPIDDCLFFCVGPKPAGSWSMYPCEIIHVEDAQNDLFAVFNAIQEIYGRLLDWYGQMQEFALSGASVRSMLEASVPLFQNRITIVDYNLNILAYCEYEEADDKAAIVMSDRFERLPMEKVIQLGKNIERSTHAREPFFVQEEGRPDNYCINLFVGNDYIGCCTLQQDIRPLSTKDFELFKVFAQFVRRTLSSQVNALGSQYVTTGMIFEQLLRRYPVSRYDVDRALSLADFNLGSVSLDECSWGCLAIRSSNSNRTYPEGYLCSAIEDMVARSAVFFLDDIIVVFFLMVPDECVDGHLDVLDEYLADMNFIAGVSRPFKDVFRANDYYQQALVALDAGHARDGGNVRCSFDDCVLDYMLERSCGDFNPRLIVDPALVELARDSSHGVDHIETLRCYLDNNCNASKTAQEMFLHRSTLTQRLETIQRYVDLSTPEKRLFLRMCLHLPDIDRVLDTGGSGHGA